MPRINFFKLTVLLVVLYLPVYMPAQDRLATPAEKYQALRKEYDNPAGPRRVLTPEERLKYVGESYRQHHLVAQKFLALAEQYPDDPVAIEALIQAIWQVNTTPWPREMVGEDAARKPAFEILQRRFAESDRLGPLCLRVSYGFCQEYESFLRAVAAKNPHHDMQGIARFGLGRFLCSRLERVALCREDTTSRKEFEDLFGKDYLAGLLKQDRQAVLQEAEQILESTREKYADVKLPEGGTVADVAARVLFEIRHLGVGKPAPEIQGEDQDGRPFKLSDYRGKVVLLDFWSYV